MKERHDLQESFHFSLQRYLVCVCGSFHSVIIWARFILKADKSEFIILWLLRFFWKSMLTYFRTPLCQLAPVSFTSSVLHNNRDGCFSQIQAFFSFCFPRRCRAEYLEFIRVRVCLLDQELRFNTSSPAACETKARRHFGPCLGWYKRDMTSSRLLLLDVVTAITEQRGAGEKPGHYGSKGC